MKKINLLIAALLIVVIALALSIFWQKDLDIPPPDQQQAVLPSPTTVKQPIVHYPVTNVAPTEEEIASNNKPSPAEESLPEILPTVQQSDESIQKAFSNLRIKPSLLKLLMLENFIQRLVVSIDNLPEKRLPRVHSPLVAPSGRFIASGTTEAPQTSTRNHTRYNAHLELLESLDQQRVVKIYAHFYPLFQTAFEQLGYKNAYFNDRLIYVIDHLLETPNPPEPLLLAQPSVLHTYADPLLEELSAGQKILLRIGPEQRKKVLNSLKGYRDKLAKMSR